MENRKNFRFVTTSNLLEQILHLHIQGAGDYFIPSLASSAYLFCFGAKPENTHTKPMPRTRTKTGGKKVIPKENKKSCLLGF